jgi:hypothetical protein
MSTNCIQCIKNRRTDTDLLCDVCRKAKREKQFRATYQIKKEFRDNPECQAAFEYAATGNKLRPDEINYVGAIIENVRQPADSSDAGAIGGGYEPF